MSIYHKLYTLTYYLIDSSFISISSFVPTSTPRHRNFQRVFLLIFPFDSLTIGSSDRQCHEVFRFSPVDPVYDNSPTDTIPISETILMLVVTGTTGFSVYFTQFIFYPFCLLHLRSKSLWERSSIRHFSSSL